MSSTMVTGAPSLETFRRTLLNKDISVDVAIESLVFLLTTRKICGSRECAEATAYLLRRIVEISRVGDISKLLINVQQIGQRLITAQPRELVVGNVIRRVLGLIREEAEEDRKGEATAGSDTTSKLHLRAPRHDSPAPQVSSTVSTIHTPSPSWRERADDVASVTRFHGTSNRPSLQLQPSPTSSKVLSAHTSMSGLLSRSVFGIASPGAASVTPPTNNHSPSSSQPLANLNATKDLLAEVVEGIEELIDEVRQADDQIAGYAHEHIHSNEIILTHSSSRTVQKFLLKAATKRKFTVIRTETYPNDHDSTYESFCGKPKANNAKGPGFDSFTKTLTAAGVTVVLIPDSAVFALMARVNKVILDSHIVLANGGIVACSGANLMARAAKVHRTPIVALGAVYKVSPVYPFDTDALMEDGDPCKVVPYENESFVHNIEIQNPLFDFVPANLVDLYVMNLGGQTAPSIQRIVEDHYRGEDLDLGAIESPS